MANIVIDPAIITIPSDNTSRDDVERWLENLTLWLKEALPAVLPRFRLGARFIQSVNERGLDTNEILLHAMIRAASNIIADKAKDIPSYRLHPFRKSETADSPQLVRESDHAKAWRLMLQKHGAGWRLHYWHIATSDGYMIEFANVCKESEREIY